MSKKGLADLLVKCANRCAKVQMKNAWAEIHLHLVSQFYLLADW